MNEENIPIDIHYNKLLDWLISRHHCQQQWQPLALTIREKINNAIQDMPEHPEITSLLKGAYINYFHCLRIVEILRETEAATKNLFGRYSSQRMKDWLEIVKLYEQDGIYLAEVAQLLIRNVNYEIPALKKQIGKCKQAQTDCTRKEGEHASNAAELKEKYHMQCKQMGIEGKKVKSELVELVRDLPSTFDEIGKSCHKLSPAIDYYQAFLQFTLGNSFSSEAIVPLIRYMVENGNTTTFQYKHGKAPSSVEEVQLNFSFALDEEDVMDESKTEEIDWGDLGAADEIDFGDEAAGDVIDFGNEGAAADGGDIDWGDDSIAVVADDSGLQEVTTTTDDNTARGTDALTLLDNADVRNAFINQLMEVCDFLGQRILELQDTSDVVSGNQFNGAPEAVQVTSEDVEKMLATVVHILDRLTTGRLKDLLPIRSSPRYVDRLADKLKKILSDSDKMLSLSRLMVTRRQEALQEEKATEPKLDLIRKRTKELKSQIAGEISKKYKGRPVNIMGEVNTV